MSDSGRKVIHTDVDTGLCVVNDSGDEQEDEVGNSIVCETFHWIMDRPQVRTSPHIMGSP